MARLVANTRSLCSFTILSKWRSTASITLLETHLLPPQLQLALPTGAARHLPAWRGGVSLNWNHDALPVVIGASDGGPTNGWRIVHARAARRSGRLRGDRAAVPGGRVPDGICGHRLSGRRRGRRTGGFREGVSRSGDIPQRCGTAAVAAADRCQRGAQPGPLRGPPPPARAANGGALPPGGCGPIPRGGGRSRGGSPTPGRPPQQAKRGRPARDREPVFARAQRRGDGSCAEHPRGHSEVTLVARVGPPAPAIR